MGNPKLLFFFRVFLPVSIFFICGVFGFATKGVPSPVFKTLELMVIVGSSGYLIYRIDPKPEAGKTMIRSKDLLQLGVVFIGVLLVVYVVSDKWQTINVLKFVTLLIGILLAARMAGKVKKQWLRKVLISILFCALMVGFDAIFLESIHWGNIFIASSFLFIPQQTNQKVNESQETSAIEEDPRVAQGIAKF